MYDDKVVDDGDDDDNGQINCIELGSGCGLVGLSAWISGK